MRDGVNVETMTKGELIKELEKLYQPESSFVFKASDSAVVFRSLLTNRVQEHFMLICLDSDKRIIKKKVVFLGTINRSLVHPREVFNYAVINDVDTIIIGHNHPSGNIQPSLEDIEITRHLEKGGEIIGVKILDHVIITDTDFYSFKKNGMILTSEV